MYGASIADTSKGKTFFSRKEWFFDGPKLASNNITHVEVEGDIAITMFCPRSGKQPDIHSKIVDKYPKVIFTKKQALVLDNPKMGAD